MASVEWGTRAEDLGLSRPRTQNAERSARAQVLAINNNKKFERPFFQAFSL